MNMLNKRCAQILYKIIDSNESLNISKLSEIFGVSNRTIRYDLDKIDDFLISVKLPQLQRKPNKGISYEHNSLQINKIFDAIGEIDSYDYSLSENERVVIIISDLLSNRNYTTIEKISDMLLVSRSTVIKDLKFVKKWFNERNIDFVSHKRYGIKIVGDEKHIRKATLNLLTENFNTYKCLDIIKPARITKNNFGFDKYYKNMFNDIDVKYIENCVNIAEEQLETKFSDEAYDNLVIHIAIAIKRIKENKDIVMSKNELQSLQITKEFAVALSIAKMFENRFEVNIPSDEIGYITIHLLGSNASIRKGIDDDWVIIEILTNDLIKNVSQKLNCKDIIYDKQLFQGLLQHIRPTVYRLKHKLTIKNPLLNEIMGTYITIFNIIKKSANSIEKYCGNELSDDEIGYLALHFEAAVERNKNIDICAPDVLVVCATGIGTAAFLSSKVKSLFNVNIVNTVSYHEVEEIVKNKKVDLIITTVPIKIHTVDIPCIEVTAFLTEKNISKISNILQKCSAKKILGKSGISLENIVQIIGKNCAILNEKELRKQLSEYLKIPDNYNRGVIQPMLQEVLTSKFIKLNVDAKDWREAIEEGGKILEDNGSIESSYIVAMIESVKRLGPYMVIAPGIAMPHARPDMGVKKIGMSLITLTKPVEFGNKENDPVRIVVCLCAIDHMTHIKALSELVKFLGDKKFVDLVLHAKDPQDIINFIKNEGGK